MVPSFQLALTEALIAPNAGTGPQTLWDLCEVCAMKVNTFLRPLPSELQREARANAVIINRDTEDAQMRHVSVKD